MVSRFNSITKSDVACIFLRAGVYFLAFVAGAIFADGVAVQAWVTVLMAEIAGVVCLLLWIGLTLDARADWEESSDPQQNDNFGTRKVRRKRRAGENSLIVLDGKRTKSKWET